MAALSAFGAQSASAASLTLSTPSNLSVNVTPSATGAFAKSAKGTITVKSDVYAGYTLKIQDNDGESALTGESGKLPSISNEITENGFNTDARYNNMWGYKPSVFNSSKNENFFPSPKQAGDVIDKTDPSSNDSVTKDYTVELGVRVDNSQPAGTYTGTFVFTATANDLKYSITYDDNNADGDKPTDKNGTAPEGTQIPLASAPTKTNYVFLGWCDKETRGEDCSGGTEYKAGGNYKLTNSANNVTLYAMWAAIPTTMQNFTPGYCKYMTVEKDVITLKDERDDNEYRVAKLKDNKCWMIDNLRLGSTLDPDTGTQQLDVNTSDNPANDFTLKMRPRNYNANNNYDIDAAYIDETYGGYYSWHTATAGTGKASMNNRGENASGSICPKGWRLPTSYSDSTHLQDNDFNTLAQIYGGIDSAGAKALQIAPIPGLMLGGLVYGDGSGFSLKDTDGHYWASTVYGANVAYDLRLNSSYVRPANTTLEYRGLSIRCTARE